MLVISEDHEDCESRADLFLHGEIYSEFVYLYPPLYWGSYHRALSNLWFGFIGFESDKWYRAQYFI